MRKVKKTTRMDLRKYLLAEADRMIRANGFETCTLSRLSDRIGVRVSSIQAYFNTREELANAVVDENVSKLSAALVAIEKRSIPTTAKLSAYSRLFRGFPDQGMPLGNQIERQKSTTPPHLAKGREDLFSVQLAWLERTIESGKAIGDFSADVDTRKEALRILSIQRPSNNPLLASAMRAPTRPFF